MSDAKKPDPRSRVALGAVALMLIVTNGLRLWNRHQESEASSRAMADLGTERDPIAQLTMPVEKFFCDGTAPAYCDLEGKWAKADTCEGKQAVRDEFMAALKNQTPSGDELKVRNGIARVMMDTEDFCKGKSTGSGGSSP